MTTPTPDQRLANENARIARDMQRLAEEAQVYVYVSQTEEDGDRVLGVYNDLGDAEVLAEAQASAFGAVAVWHHCNTQDGGDVTFYVDGEPTANGAIILPREVV